MRNKCEWLAAGVIYHGCEGHSIIWSVWTKIKCLPEWHLLLLRQELQVWCRSSLMKICGLLDEMITTVLLDFKILWKEWESSKYRTKQRQKDLSALYCFIIFNHALELIVSGIELFPNNLELPFLIIFYVSHVGKKAKFFVIQSTWPFLEVHFLRKCHSEVIVSHSESWS